MTPTKALDFSSLLLLYSTLPSRDLVLPGAGRCVTRDSSFLTVHLGDKTKLPTTMLHVLALTHEFH